METIAFVLNGCDISFVARAPKDITLEQLLKQCDKIVPDWCACGIKTLDYSTEIELEIGYDSIRKLTDCSCTIKEN